MLKVDDYMLISSLDSTAPEAFNSYKGSAEGLIRNSYFKWFQKKVPSFTGGGMRYVGTNHDGTLVVFIKCKYTREFSDITYNFSMLYNNRDDTKTEGYLSERDKYGTTMRVEGSFQEGDMVMYQITRLLAHPTDNVSAKGCIYKAAITFICNIMKSCLDEEARDYIAKNAASYLRMMGIKG